MFDIQKGLETLKEYIKIAPEKPGVYRMIDASETVLYVGKAKNIKKRIVAYSHLNKLPVRLQQMVAQINRMEFIVVENEARALLVENELIKKFKPRYMLHGHIHLYDLQTSRSTNYCDTQIINVFSHYVLEIPEGTF